MVKALRFPAPIRGVNALIDETLTVRDIVDKPIWTFDPEVPAHHALASMRAQRFDVAAVGPSPRRRFVRCEALVGVGGVVDDCAEVIPIEACLDRSVALGRLFEHLALREQIFVLDGDRVRWLVTRADLNAPAVGVAVLAYLTVIEGGFRELARPLGARYLLSRFDDERRDRIERLYQVKVRRNADVGVHDCLTLGDWMTVVLKSDDFREQLGFSKVVDHHRETAGFEPLRNTVAHGGSLLDELSPIEALAAIDRARSYATRVWNAVDRMQPIWQAYVTSEIVVTRSHGKRPLTGANSGATLPVPVLHVLSAWNPGSIGTDTKQNRDANRQLRAHLRSEGLSDVRSAIVRLRAGMAEEESFVVGGLTRQRAAAIGGLFNQAAIFELDHELLRVVRCPDGFVMADRPRRPQSESTT